MEEKSTSILIAGDLVIDQAYKTSNINSNVVDLFNNSDLNIVNLEAPVTASNSKIIKTGPHLKSNEKSTLEVLKVLRIDAVTLANNHLLDYDEKGVKDTLEFCENNKIHTIGAGMNLNEASKTKYFDTKEGKIALVNFAENEWSSATEETAGANPMDIIDNTNQIKEAKKNADFVFVIIHGGHEYYNLPSPRMQKQYRFYAEQGADLIVGHHTHCISGHETYKGVPIYYSLGNFLFTKPSTYEDWYSGLVLRITIDDNKKIKTDEFVIKQQRDFSLKLLNDNETKIIIDRFNNYSEIINNKFKLNKSWHENIKHETTNYLKILSPNSFLKNRYLRGVANRLKINNKRGNSLLLNMLKCESHRDLSIEVSKKYLNDKIEKIKVD